MRLLVADLALDRTAVGAEVVDLRQLDLARLGEQPVGLLPRVRRGSAAPPRAAPARAAAALKISPRRDVVADPQHARARRSRRCARRCAAGRVRVASSSIDAEPRASSSRIRAPSGPASAAASRSNVDDAGPAAVGPPRQRERRASRRRDRRRRTRAGRDPRARPGRLRACGSTRDSTASRLRPHVRTTLRPVAAERTAGAAQHEVPRLEHEPRHLARHELVAQRARRLLRLAQPQREQHVVEVDRRELERVGRQRATRPASGRTRAASAAARGARAATAVGRRARARAWSRDRCGSAPSAPSNAVGDVDVGRAARAAEPSANAVAAQRRAARRSTRRATSPRAGARRRTTVSTGSSGSSISRRLAVLQREVLLLRVPHRLARRPCPC